VSDRTEEDAEACVAQRPGLLQLFLRNGWKLRWVGHLVIVVLLVLLLSRIHVRKLVVCVRLVGVVIGLLAEKVRRI